jgi:hypothetical protein
MLPYWVMFLLLAVPATTAKVQVRGRGQPAWLAVGLLLVLFVGYRHWVGGDWFAYVRHFEEAARVYDWRDIWLTSDPGYVYLNWLMNQWGFEVYAVNLVSATILITGIVAFARRQPYPWIALAVAFPYLIVVVGMGYTRQAVAIGFILLALNALELRQFARYLVFIALATLFHRTALIMIPLGFFLWGRGWVFRAFALVTAAYALYDLLVAEDVSELWQNYVEAEMQSQGAMIRAVMNIVPAALLLLYWKNWRTAFPDYWFWFWIAVGALLCIPLLGFASTAVDRIALYFLPMQMVVFARLPYLMQHRFNPGLLKAGIVAGYAAVLYVWLNYAAHSIWWVPYRNALFE